MYLLYEFYEMKCEHKVHTRSYNIGLWLVELVILSYKWTYTDILPMPAIYNIGKIEKLIAVYFTLVE